jgi:hypothetical protein
MPRKTTDPVLVKLLDTLAKEQASCDRWYARLKRAFTALDKAKRRCQRLAKRVEQHRQPKPSPAA